MTTKPILVAVYSPTGEKEMHTVPNARDLVNGAEYTWRPGVEASPVDSAPIKVTPPTGPSKAQQIFDSTGHNAERSINDVISANEEEEPEIFDAGADEEAPAKTARKRK